MNKEGKTFEDFTDPTSPVPDWNRLKKAFAE